MSIGRGGEENFTSEIVFYVATLSTAFRIGNRARYWEPRELFLRLAVKYVWTQKPVVMTFWGWTVREFVWLYSFVEWGQEARANRAAGFCSPSEWSKCFRWCASKKLFVGVIGPFLLREEVWDLDSKDLKSKVTFFLGENHFSFFYSRTVIDSPNLIFGP